MAKHAELLSLSSVEMRRRIGSKEISPVELLEACIDRIAEINPAVNAVTATCYARARKEAKAAEKAVRDGDALGALHGLPVGVKDLENTGGLLTTYGSPIYKDNIPENDTVMVARIRAAGGIVVAKTNVPEFGAGANSRNPVWGATGNPFDPTKNAGGSSGGSAVALATDMLPVCTGSDTGGSLRIPGAVNGVVGFRPSPGLVPHTMRPMGWSAISVLGPMGRTVADTCQLMAAQAGQHDIDPLSYEVDAAGFAAPKPIDLGRLKVAWTEDFGTSPVDKPIRKVFRDRIKAMRHLFLTCDEIKPDLGKIDECFDVVRAIGFVGRYREAYEKDPSSLGPNIRANYELGAKMTMADVAWAHLEQTRIYPQIPGAVPRLRSRARADRAGVTVPVDAALSRGNGRQAAAQLLSLAVADVRRDARNQPGDFDSLRRRSRGLPIRASGVGRARADGFVLSAAHAMEQAFTGNAELKRPLPDLRSSRSRRRH